MGLASAQYGTSPLSASAPNVQPRQLRDVGLDQKLDAQIPLDLTFQDEWNKPVALRDLFAHGKPVVLTLVYYECPMLCNLVLNGLVKTMRAMSLDAGKDFEIVTVSFDHREHADIAAAKKKSYIERYQRPGAEKGWHFLTGDEASIKRLADAVGFRFAFDETTGQFAHASGIMVATPQGKLARYLYGVEYSAKDLRLGLVEAAKGKIGNPVDQLMLYCFHYDPNTGKYSLAVVKTIQALGTATVLGLVALVFVLTRRDRRQKVA